MSEEIDAKTIVWPPTSDEVEIGGLVFNTNPIRIQVSREFLRDMGWFPWENPHHNPMPYIVPFPRVALWQRRANAARTRLAETWDVLRHGLPERDEDDW